MSGVKDSEWFEDFKFIPPPEMVDGDLTLKVRELFKYDPVREYVPAYRFDMVHTTTGEKMGDIDLRVGLTKKLQDYGGHIGYDVEEPYRGHRYATRSCRLLLPLARSLGINPLVITCDPRNIPSVKTIEALDGARLMATKDVVIESGELRPTAIYHVFMD